MARTPLTSIPGIGEATAHRLTLLGIPDAEALLATPADLLASMPGFHRERAERVLNAAAALLVSSPTPTPDAQPAAGKVKSEKPKKKKKKKSKKAEKDTGAKKPKAKDAKEKDTKKSKKKAKKKKKKKKGAK